MHRLKPTYYATLALVVLLVAQLSLAEFGARNRDGDVGSTNRKPDVIRAHLRAVQTHFVLKTVSSKSALKRNLATPPAAILASVSADGLGVPECDYGDRSVRNVQLSFIRDRGPPAAV
jgi:hypothetical protein